VVVDFIHIAVYWCALIEILDIAKIVPDAIVKNRRRTRMDRGDVQAKVSREFWTFIFSTPYMTVSSKS
jgi:hypothetical protein